MLAIYVRVSSAKQADRLSLDEQTAAGKAFAESRNQDYSLYIDIKSAKNIIDRDDFVLLLADIDSGKINELWVGDIDRLTRSMEDGGRLKKLIDNHLLKIYDRGKEIQSFEFAFRVLFADEERQKIIERTTRNRRSQIDDGENRYRSIYGYKAENIGQKKNGVILRKWVVDEEEAEMIRFVYQLYFKDYGFDDIVAELVQGGYKTKRGGGWDRGTIHNILRRPEYIGMTHDSKGNTIPSKVYTQEIIDRKTWETVQSTIDAKIKNRQGKYFKAASYDSSGLITCKVCSAPYSFHPVKSHGKVTHQNYMHKTIQYNHRNCIQSPQNLRRETIDYLFRSLFILTFGDYSKVRQFLDLEKNKIENENKDLQKNVIRLKKNLQSLEEQKKRLIDGVSQGVFEALDIAEKLIELKGKIETEKINLNIVQDEMKIKMQNLDALVRKFAENSVEDYLNATEKQRREINMQYIDYAKIEGFIVHVRYIIGIEYIVDLQDLSNPSELLLTMTELKIATIQGKLDVYCQTLRIAREEYVSSTGEYVPVVMEGNNTKNNAIELLQAIHYNKVSSKEYMEIMGGFYIVPTNRNKARVRKNVERRAAVDIGDQVI